MSIKLMSLVFDYPMKGLSTDNGKPVSSSSCAFVLLALADHANDEGRSCYPGISRIARKTKLSERTVYNVISALESAGFISQDGTSYRGTNTYIIHLDKLEEGVNIVQGEHSSGVGVNSVQGGGEHSSGEPSVNHHKPSGGITYEPCNEDGEPIVEKPKKKKKKVDKTPPDIFVVAEALAEVTGMSLPMNKGRIFAEAKLLLKDERVSGALIRSVYSAGGKWYTEDWRGKKGQKPRLHEVRETLFTFGAPKDGGTIKGGVLDR